MKRLRGIFLPILTALAVGICLFAVACGKNVTLKFETNGGNAISSLTVERGTEIELPEPEREGYAFAGWYTSADFSGDALRGKISAPESNTTYHAKWEQGYLLSLDLDGGELDVGKTSYYLAEGANVFDLLSGLNPRKTGLTFGAWFNGEEPVSGFFAMPASALSLKARYKVSYTVESYRQNIAGNSFIRSEEVTDGSDYVGKELTLEAPFVEHFTVTDAPENATPVSSLTLKEDASENVFKFYYTRNRYTVTYLPNASGATGSVARQTGAYGASLETSENGFKAEGYRFAGWGTRQTGDVEYLPGSRVQLLDDIQLFAIWDRGYTDRFGSSDLIFFPRQETEKAILLRGGHEFEGTRDGDSFLFVNERGETMLEGAVYGGAFSYRHTELVGDYIFLDSNLDPSFDESKRYDENRVLTIGENLNATYREGDRRTEGSLVYDGSRGDYLFTPSDGGASFHVLFREGDSNHEKLFSVSGEEMGLYVELLGLDLPYFTGEALVLDGYGGALLYLSLGGQYFGFDGVYYIAAVREIRTGMYMYKVSCTIEDELGLLGSEPGVYDNYVMTVPLDTEDEEEQFDGYVAANGLMGSYRSAGFGSLRLDGLGYFADSAVYTDADGGIHSGSYVYESDNKTGIVVTMTSGEEEYSFVVKSGEFTLFDPASKNYREYSRVTDGFDYPILVIYEDDLNGGKRTELYQSFDGGETLTLVGTGCQKAEETKNGLQIYSFNLDHAETGYKDSVPSKMLYYFTEVMSTEDNRARSVYCILEYDGEKWYEVYDLGADGELWANSQVTLTGVGSLLFGANGYFEGSYTARRSESFSYDYIEFLYGSAQGNVTLRYTVSEGEDGVLHGTALMGTELELLNYWYDEETGVSQYVTDLVLDRFVRADGGLAESGEARYNYDHGEGNSWQFATYEKVDSSLFGEDVYSLTIGGRERFRFLVTLFTDSYGTTSYVYFIYNETYEGEYVSPAGGKLVLDGFYWASYSDADGVQYEGGYSVSPDGEEVYFTPENAEAFYLLLQENRTFYALDAAYGEYTVVDYNFAQINNATMVLDGRGNATLSYPGLPTPNVGFYTAYDLDSNEYIIDINLGNPYGRNAWHFQLYTNPSFSLCILYNEETAGTFINDDWDVLWLDGFGGGTLSTADGSVSASGEYYLASDAGQLVLPEEYSDFAFMVFTLYDEAETQVPILFNQTARTFEVMDYDGFDGLYLSDNFEYLAFSEDGALFMGNARGIYFYLGETVYAYIWHYTEGFYQWAEFPLPKGAEYTVSYDFDRNGTPETVTLYRWNTGAEEALRGTIKFFAEEGDRVLCMMNASLDIQLSIGALYNIPAAFTIEEGSYAGQTYNGTYSFILNPYTDGALHPRVTYGGVDYWITFHMGSRSFEVEAGFAETVLRDYYDAFREDLGDEESGEISLRGGEIVKQTIGFGPLSLNAATYAGRFYYHNDAHPGERTDCLTFEGVEEDEVRVIGYRAGLNELYEIVFLSGGKRYAVDFYETESEETGSCYVLQGFFEYEERTVTGYTVGVKYLIRASMPNTPGYGYDEFGDGSMAGKPIAATLTPDGAEAVVSYDTGVSIGGDVWFAEYLGYDDAGRLRVGTAYLVEFETGTDGKVSEVAVSTYTLRQKQIAGYMINFYVDEDGEVATLIAVAYSDSNGNRAWLEKAHGLEKQGDDWTFYATPGSSTEVKYTVSFTKQGDDYVVTVKAE